MRAIAPQVDAPQVTVAEEQDEFKPITAAIVMGPTGKMHVLAFRPSEEERRRIAFGADIYVSLLTFGGPMQGIIVFTGKEDVGEAFGIEVTR